MPVPEGRTQFRNPGLPPRLTLQREGEEISVDATQHSDDFRVKGGTDEVTIDRFGFQTDVTFRRSGDDIVVDRPGYNLDTAVRRQGNELTVDRAGVHNDVSARFSEDKIQIRHHGTNSITSLERRGEDVLVRQHGYTVDQYPATLFPGGWPAEPNLTAIADHAYLTPRTADALDRWSKDGIDVDDLIRVNRQGEVHTFDHEYQ